MTVRAILNEKALEKNLRPSTLLSYTMLFQRMGFLDSEPPSQEDVLERLWKIDNPNTRRSAAIAVRSILGYKLKVPRGEPRRYVLPSEDTLRLALMTSPHEIRGLLMMYAGARIGEAAAITGKDLTGDRLRIDKQVMELHHPGEPTTVRIADVKSYAATIVIPHFLADRVRTLEGRSKPSCIRESLRRSGLKAGIRLNPHQLRHWYITHLLAKGAPLELVRRQARHASIQTTLSHYQQFSEQDVHGYFE